MNKLENSRPPRITGIGMTPNQLEANDEPGRIRRYLDADYTSKSPNQWDLAQHAPNMGYVNEDAMLAMMVCQNSPEETV